MVYWTKWCVLMIVLMVSVLENAISPVYRLVAQEATVTESCNPEESGQNQVIMALEAARYAVENKKGEDAIGSLQGGLAIALVLKDTRILPSILEQWLIDATEGYSTTRLQRLLQLVDSPLQSAKVQLVLNQLLQLTNRLTPATSYLKTRTLAAIANQYAILGQSPSALTILNQARQSANSISDPIFITNALMDVAEGYAAISQTQPTLAILNQIEQTIPQVPPHTSEPLKLIIWQRMAATYAQIGDYTKAQQIVTQLPQNSETQSVAIRGVVEAYIAEPNLEMAEKLSLAIANPSQQVLALAPLALAYHQTGQPNKTTQLLDQAVQLVQLPEITRDPILQDTLVKTLVDAYLKIGKIDQAFQLAQSALGNSKAESLKKVMIAYNKTGNSDRVQQWLSAQLNNIHTTPSDWEQRLYLGDLLQTAIDIQQFDWISQQWQQIDAIDYGFGLQDWRVIQIATAYANTGKYLQALQWVQQLPLDNRPVLKIKLLGIIALKADQAGDTASANKLLDQTLATIDPIVSAYQQKLEREGGNLFERDRIKPQALAAIALAYSQIGQAEITRKLLAQVIELDVNMSDPSIATPIDHPFAMFIEAQEYIGALQIAQGTKDPEIRESRLQQSAIGLVKQNRFDLVLPVVQQLKYPNNQTQLLLAIAQRYGELQQLESALPILAQAFQVAKTIPGAESEFMYFGADSLTQVDREDDRGSSLTAIALQYAQFQQFEQAYQVANTLQEQQPRQQTITRIQCLASRE